MAQLKPEQSGLAELNGLAVWFKLEVGSVRLERCHTGMTKTHHKTFPTVPSVASCRWSSPSTETQKKAHSTTWRSLQWLNSSRNKKWLSRIKRFGSVRFRLELGSVRLERCHTSLGQVSQTSNFQVCFAFCFLFFAFCFLPFAFCFLLFAFCFMNPLCQHDKTP